ncbi:hypothetical protein ACWDR0_12135 [Streptomyces sp. NPDC003691]
MITDGDRTYRVFRGLVAAGDRMLADPGRALEHRLLAALPEQYAELRPVVARALAEG